MDNTIKEIQYLYDKIDNKSEAISIIAKQTDRKHNSVKVNWLSNTGGWSIPKKFREAVKETLLSLQ